MLSLLNIKMEVALMFTGTLLRKYKEQLALVKSVLG